MSGNADIAAARAAFLAAFAWISGHADLWPAFAHGPTLSALVDGLSAPWLDQGITHVVGVEARGFLLGAAVAVGLGVGCVAVRKPGALFPRATLTATSGQDYRGLEHELRMQDVLGPGDVVLLVDDWAQTGSQAIAVQSLVERGRARLAGLSLLVDQLDDEVRSRFCRVTSLVRAEELGEPG